MSCKLGPVVPLPILPAPYSIAPPALPPLPDSTLDFCCRQVGFTIPPLPPIFPPGVTVAFPAILNAMLAAVEAYLDALPLTCPKE